jgi:hypothetical protein
MKMSIRSTRRGPSMRISWSSGSWPLMRMAKISRTDDAGSSGVGSRRVGSGPASTGGLIEHSGGR